MNLKAKEELFTQFAKGLVLVASAPNEAKKIEAMEIVQDLSYSIAMEDIKIIKNYLIDRSDEEYAENEEGIQFNQPINFYFLRDDLKDKNIIVEGGDIIEYDGEFYEISYDQVMMLPMLEMAGTRSKYVPEVTYVYNITNPNAVNKTKAQKQHEYMLEIRKKPKYNRL